MTGEAASPPTLCVSQIITCQIIALLGGADYYMSDYSTVGGGSGGEAALGEEQVRIRVKAFHEFKSKRPDLNFCLFFFFFNLEDYYGHRNFFLFCFLRILKITPEF